MSRLAQTMARSDARRRRRPVPPVVLLDYPDVDAPPLLSDDLRLFLLTFLGGFLFMSVYLA